MIFGAKLGAEIHQAMVDILCLSCGRVIDSHAAFCPDCQRCPNCGTKHRDGETICRTCEHPANEAKLRTLEDRAGADLPANKKLRSDLDRERVRAELMKRLNLWKFVLLAVLLAFPFTLIAIYGLPLVGLSGRWTGSVVLLMWLVFQSWWLPGMLEKGRFRWLLRDKK